MRSSEPVPGAAPGLSGEPIAVTAARHGIDRRALLRWSAGIATALALPVIPFADKIANALAAEPRLPVLWLNGQDCTADSEGFLRASNPTPSQLILDYLSVDYAEVLMAPSGDAAEERLASTMANFNGRYVVVVEGSIPTASNGIYCCVSGKSFAQTVKDVSAGALAVIAVGGCATDGGLPLAAGGPTGAVSVSTVLAGMGKTIINLPGCPMNVENLTATLVQYITLGTWPDRDSSGRPLFAYGARIHSSCPRLPFFRAGQYVRTWGDAGHQAGWCLRYVGCQGQTTYANCATKKFNSGTSFPIQAGAPCLGCTKSNFWSNLSSSFSWTPPAATLTQETADALIAASN